MSLFLHSSLKKQFQVHYLGKAKFLVIMFQRFSKSRDNKDHARKRELEVPFALLHQSRNEDEELFTLTAPYIIQIKTPMPTGLKDLAELKYKPIFPERGLHWFLYYFCQRQKGERSTASSSFLNSKAVWTDVFTKKNAWTQRDHRSHCVANNCHEEIF